MHMKYYKIYTIMKMHNEMHNGVHTKCGHGYTVVCLEEGLLMKVKHTMRKLRKEKT